MRAYELMVALGAMTLCVVSGCSQQSAEPVAEKLPVSKQTTTLPPSSSQVRTTFDSDFYHLDGCEDLKGRDAYAGPIDEAKQDGFIACPKCNPPA